LTVRTFAQSDTRLQRLEQAAALISANRTAEAEKELQAILKLSPDDSGALNLLGTVRAQQGRYAEAVVLFTRAIRSDKLFVGPHLNLAHLYSLSGKRAKAIQELKQVMQLEPQNTEGLDQLARLLLAEGQIDEGIQVLDEGEKTQQLSGSLLILRGDA